MSSKKWIARLTDEERLHLQQALTLQECDQRRLKRARILLMADAGRSNRSIAVTVRVSASTVILTLKRYTQGGVDLVLTGLSHPKR